MDPIRTVVRSTHGFLIVDTQELPELLGSPNDIKYCVQKFETMVFRCDANGSITDYKDVDCALSYTPEEAKEAHRLMVEKWQL